MPWMGFSKSRIDKMKKAIILITFVMAIIASLLIGQRLGERKAMENAAIEVDGIQVDLIFNRILSEKKMQSMLSKGCITETQNALGINLDQDTKLLAEFFKGKLTPDAIKYVSDRDPELVSSLRTFKSKYGSSWTEMECKK